MKEGARFNTKGGTCAGAAGVAVVTMADTAGSPFSEEIEMGVCPLQVGPMDEPTTIGVVSVVVAVLNEEGPA